ncbi:MAG: MotA/TolQ/ExbB proton channel family protein [Casimicrobiaceae bacterium]|nr:MotA/TolQ/ExbB proton channel family protein [Casimicrobiaceae bacterium]MCX8099027.1 MotA/TolQ/ExbB proton channel family protein [Casimicrobiaceae bacterium]MDW8312909.1 MotA/TolQ/ExbB proton channel family protein [Burkholderiales bacterium]
MWEIIKAAGWPIWPLIAISIVAVALIIERALTLRRSQVIPPGLTEKVIEEYRRKGLTQELVNLTAAQGPLGQVLAAGLANLGSPREVMKEAIEATGVVVAHGLEKYLNALATIATAAPLMGLFGTIVGMIEIFGSQNATGTDPAKLASGISVALYNAAMGILVAIPALMFYRYFRGKVDALLIDMEQEATRLVDVLHGERVK